MLLAVACCCSGQLLLAEACFRFGTYNAVSRIQIRPDPTLAICNKLSFHLNYTRTYYKEGEERGRRACLDVPSAGRQRAGLPGGQGQNPGQGHVQDEALGGRRLRLLRGGRAEQARS